MAFKETLALVLQWEGVYDDDPDDAGGETCFGITRVFEPEWSGWPIVADLLKAQVPFSAWKDQAALTVAVEAHYALVWAHLDLDYCPSDKLDSCIMGGYVNQGPRVERWFQEAIAELGVPVMVDGSIGPSTMRALAEVLKWPYGETALLNGLMLRRARAYSKSKPKYIAGLLNRLWAGA